METLDLIIVSSIVLLAIFYILNKIKAALLSKESDGCSGCDSAQGCSTTQRASCDGNVEGEVFK